jgi:hypothetical protein
MNVHHAECFEVSGKTGAIHDPLAAAFASDLKLP